jgi:hypothetical protein
MIPERPFYWLLVLFSAAAIMAYLIGGSSRNADKRSATSVDVNILSNNRILSPDTTIIVNSNNPQTTGDHSPIEMMPGIIGCWDGIQYRPGACVKP